MRQHYEFKGVGAYEDSDDMPRLSDGTPVYDAYFYMEATEITPEEYEELVSTGKSVYHV